MSTTDDFLADIEPQPDTGTAEHRANVISSLREFADWLETNPDVPVNAWETITWTHFAEDRDHLRALAKTLGGRLEKRGTGDFYEVRRQFGSVVSYQVLIPRAEVCERVVTTETVEVEGPDPEAVAALPVVKRTETVEKVEWKCPESIIAPPSGSKPDGQDSAA